MNTFSRNDHKLRGSAGAVAVLHTHNRRLDFHPHVHLVMPAVAFDAKQRLWREKDSPYLFNHKALAKVFRGKMLASLQKAGLILPASERVGGGLQSGGLGAYGAGVPWPLFISRRVTREKHRVQPQRVGDVSLPKQRN